MVFLRAGKITARSRPIEFGWSSRKDPNEFPKLVLLSAGFCVVPPVKVNSPRGLKVWVCRRSCRSRRTSIPHLNIWVPFVLVQLLTMLKFVTDRSHGRLAENPSIGVVKLFT